MRSDERMQEALIGLLGRLYGHDVDLAFSHSPSL